MFEFLINLFRLIRPLSNVKNALIICLAFFLSGAKFNMIDALLGFLSLSFIYSAVYAFNTLSDQKYDKFNKNKWHYSKSISYFKEKNVLVIISLAILLGLLFGIMINYYFLASLLFLLIFNFLYSSPITRFKDKIVLDVLFSSVFTFALRFIAAWFIFEISFPPALPILALVFSKSAGYMLYKEKDRSVLIKNNIRNSITAVNKRTNIIISAVLFFFSVSFITLICLNERYFQIDWWGYVPFNLIFLIPFVFPPIIGIYLYVLDKISTDSRKLRIVGFLYAILILTLLLI